MTLPARDPFVYCLACGRVATLESRGLVANRPIVRCAYRDAKGDAKGCGRQPGTWSALEAENVVAAARVRRATARHGRHATKRNWSDDCERCIYAERHDLHLLDSTAVPACQACDDVRPHDYHLAQRRFAPGCASCSEAKARVQPVGHHV